MEDLELRDRIGEVVTRELHERGFERSPRPDLHVTCKLALKREQVVRKLEVNNPRHLKTVTH